MSRYFLKKCLAKKRGRERYCFSINIKFRRDYMGYVIVIKVHGNADSAFFNPIIQRENVQ
jgi:hypothetical protein